MSELTYHKRIVKQRNTLQSKRRYKAKRIERTNKQAEEIERISYEAEMKLKMAMNPQDYRDYLDMQRKKGVHKTAIPDLVPEIKKEITQPKLPVKYNFIEKIILWVRNLFNKK